MDAERAQPLRLELESAIAGRLLITSALAIEQFEVLLSQYGGPVEKERWLQLLSTIQVFPFGQQNQPDVGECAIQDSVDGAAMSDNRAIPLGAAMLVPMPRALNDSDAGCFPSAIAPPFGIDSPLEMVQGIEALGLQSTCSAGQTACLHDKMTMIADVTSVVRWPNRVAEIERLSVCAKAVLGLGDAAHALTLTANGRAVQTAALQGVLLETYLHRAAWLTGM